MWNRSLHDPPYRSGISNAWNRTKHGEYVDRILPTFPADLAEYATRRLRIDGIQVLTGVGTKSATGTSVELNDGTVIPTSTIVATIGNGPHPLLEASLRLRR